MSRKTLPGALLAALILLIVAAPASAAPRSFYGIVPQLTPRDSEFTRMGKGKVGAYRWPLSRQGIEIAPRAYDWSATDHLLTELAINGIKPVPFATGRGNGGRYRDFLRAAVERYGPQGEFWSANPQLPERPIGDWQIGNEVNSSTFNKGGPRPRKYVRHLRVSARAIHSEDPGAYILFAGMFGTPHPDNGPGMTAWTFLSKAYAAGAKRYFDAVAPHPYARSIGDLAQQVKRFRKVMRAHHDSGADLWITELGWSSRSGISSFLGRGKRGQARMLQGSFRLLTRERRKWNVRGVMWFTLKDHHDPNFCTWCDTAGLFSKKFKPKPAWKRFVRFTGGKR